MMGIVIREDEEGGRGRRIEVLREETTKGREEHIMTYNKACCRGSEAALT